MSATGWQPIETAPRNGTVFLAYFCDTPAFVAFVDMEASERVVWSGPFWNRKREVTTIEERGFRVLMAGRGGLFGVHGNYAPFTPTHWMPLPPAPEAA